MDKQTLNKSFLTAEETLDFFVGDTSDSFDANYREKVIEAIEMYAFQFRRGIITIPDAIKLPNEKARKATSTQQIRTHIEHKIRYMESNKAPANILTTLKTLNQELTQYL